MIRSLFQRLRSDLSGMAMVEFGLSLPFVVLATMGGAELTNYVTTKMRISQLALQVADNASRIGTGTVLSNKTISEAQINDLLTGANMQAGNLNLFTNGRVIISSLQPGATANTYVVKWTRCKGMKSHTFGSPYFAAGTTERSTTTASANPYNVTPPSGGAVMFVQITYNYQPLINSRYQPFSTIQEIAAMTVRDNRDYAGGTDGIYNAENATRSLCSSYTAT